MYNACYCFSVGFLTEVKNKGPSEGREIRIDFPTDHDWKGLFEEIEKVPAPPVKVCTLVEG